MGEAKQRQQDRRRNIKLIDRLVEKRLMIMFGSFGDRGRAALDELRRRQEAEDDAGGAPLSVIVIRQADSDVATLGITCEVENLYRTLPIDLDDRALRDLTVSCLVGLGASPEGAAALVISLVDAAKIAQWKTQKE